jgi:hypothetical protein
MRVRISTAVTFKFTPRAILRWPAQENIETALIDPGKPWQNGMNESEVRETVL